MGWGFTYLRFSSDSGSLVSFSGIRIVSQEGRRVSSHSDSEEKGRERTERPSYFPDFGYQSACCTLGYPVLNSISVLEVLNLCAQHYVFV